MAKPKEETKNVMTQNQIATPDGWETEQTGFPPYWSPEEGKMFKGKVIGYDPDTENDGAFPRFTILATAPAQCARGPADDQVEALVNSGELFNVSSYVQLPLENYMGFEVLVKAKTQRDIKQGRTTWDFELRCSPDTKRLVADRQAKLLAEANAALPSG